LPHQLDRERQVADEPRLLLRGRDLLEGAGGDQLLLVRELLERRLAELPPLVGRDVHPEQRDDVGLLVVQVLDQGVGELVQSRRQRLAVDRRHPPGLQLGPHLRRPLGHRCVLLLHPVDQLRLRRGALEEEGPDVLVLAGVVVVQPVEEEVEMRGDRPGARGGRRRGAPYQPRDLRKAAAEDAVDDRHLLGAGCGPWVSLRPDCAALHGAPPGARFSSGDPDNQVYLMK
jgi:hypothetical protein